VVHVADGPDVHVRLGALEFCLGHVQFLVELSAIGYQLSVHCSEGCQLIAGS
jgi:hypothetical protein